MTFNECIASIEMEYMNLGHRRGWRFLTSSLESFGPESRILLLSLNPGGHSEPPDHPKASCEAGSAYRVECWPGYPAGRAPLQVQVQLLAKALGTSLDTLLSAYFVPFRSPNFASMHKAQESIDFAIRLWEGAMDSLSPNLVVCLGKETEKWFREVIGQPLSENQYPVGWGAHTALVTRYRDRVVLALPHLSRFRVFGRSESGEALEQIFAVVARLRSELTTSVA